MTSSIRSSSICRSKRQLGGVTVIVPSPCVLQPQTAEDVDALRLRSAACRSPWLRARRARSPVALRQVQRLVVDRARRRRRRCRMISRVMRSMCSTVSAGSTPRSKRCPASVAKLKRRERPGHRFGPPERGLDIDVRRVVGHRSGIAAHDAGQRFDLLCVGNHAHLFVDSMVLPFSSFSVSPARPQRTTSLSWILSRSKMCDGRPYSNIT